MVSGGVELKKREDEKADMTRLYNLIRDRYATPTKAY